MPKKTFLDDIKEEIDDSNIRLSSSDDLCYAVDIIDRLIKHLEPYDRRYEKPHPDDCHCIFCD